MTSFNVNDQGSLDEAILHVYDNKLFTDVTVKCSPGDLELSAHKLILAFFSPVFSDKFFGKGRIECSHILIKEFAPSAVQNMINFFYGQPWSFESIYEIKETKKIAEKYKIEELGNICKKEFSSVEVDLSNVLEILDMALDYENENKESECLSLISQHQETVFSMEAFKKVKFERVCDIFSKFRQRGSLTEIQYLKAIARWAECENVEYKDKLKSTIQISELNDNDLINTIILFPDFFTSSELSHAFQTIRSASVNSKSVDQSKIGEVTNESRENFKEEGTPLQSVSVAEENSESSSSESPSITEEEKEVSSESDSGIELKSKDEFLRNQQKNKVLKKNKLTITILDKGGKLAIIEFEDNCSYYTIGLLITEHCNDGKLASLSQKEGSHVFDDVDLSYDGLYSMIAYLQDEKVNLSSVSYIEALKAAIFLDLKKIQDLLLTKIYNIIDYDPYFLDGLRYFPFFEDKVLYILHTNAGNVILHPHFISCSYEFLEMILDFDEINYFSELALLSKTILWLEAENRLRWHLRHSLLSKIDFKNITVMDLELTKKKHPDFFTDDEMQSLLSLKMNGVEEAGDLPSWCNLQKSRKFINQ